MSAPTNTQTRDLFDRASPQPPAPPTVREVLHRGPDRAQNPRRDHLARAAMSDDFVVLREHPSMITYIDSLQRKNATALSFYPRQVFEREQSKGRLFLGMLNGEPCGYLYVGAPTWKDVKCHQVCIQYDARRRLYGAAIVAVMEQYATEAGATAITLRCGFDLDANEFWKSMGYLCVAHNVGGVRRMRTINVWRKQLRPELFETLAIEPAVGIVDASLWRKHKQTGVVTQFVRGAAMKDYRASLVKAAEADAHD